MSFMYLTISLSQVIRIKMIVPCQRLVTDSLVIDLGKDVLDGSALEICPLNHVAGFWRF